ncbi:retrograde regulation protein 2 [Purpureocillium takamizusanense]|uniref:Retrograde regulation protein 2 n=1 Tax=Purpureocillium takamizusanense TaxID=2060973 RepID=A0A9Q8V7X2_9HYPO|nr:retrograde regulation protein 2 [Purpureocillium takamizusanense]UNI14946.1 retrograde regulation protein 2 [Purpureocillium takamizusanense]
MTPPHVVTLDNLSTQLQPWRPDDDSHLYAIVDMGSNGIRFSITSLAPPTTRLLVPVYSARAAISLFDALTPSPSGLVFPSETMDAVGSALSRFHQIALLHGVPPSQILILATEAMRRAANASQMLTSIAKATDGLAVQILDPSVETLFGAVMGSRSGLVDVKGGALFLDLGGGSVQMTWVDTSQAHYELHAALAGESLPYGAAKLTRVLEEQPPEIHQAEIGTLEEGIDCIYANLCSRFPALQAIKSAHDRGESASVDVYMCGGGFRGYGSMLMHNDPISPYPISSINSYSVSGRVFRQTSEMRRLNREYDGKIFGMSKRRRRQFPAIATVIEAFIAAVPNIGRVTFCGGSNRQGVLMMKLPPEVRESNPLDVLAQVSEQERPMFDAVLRLLQAALPDMHPTTPTPISLGLGPLLIRRIWDRCGYDSNTNASFALHDAVTRNPDCPGLTHLTRAILGLAVCARWGTGVGPADEQLFMGLRRIADDHDRDASFWALYLGAVCGVLANIFPVMPQEPEQLLSAITFHAVVEPGKSSKRDKVFLSMGLASKYQGNVDPEALADGFQSALSNKGDKTQFKTSFRATSLS